MIKKIVCVAFLAALSACSSPGVQACNRVFRSRAVVQTFAPVMVARNAVFQPFVFSQACHLPAIVQSPFSLPVVVAAPAVQEIRTRTVVRSRSRVFGRRRGW
tara:strand:- start:5729 stop:6034 length:306 start_codon:yes stop_codon:yes gene_type:complete